MLRSDERRPTGALRRTLSIALLLAGIAVQPARAEGTLRVAQQFGIVYLLLDIVQDQKLVEKYGKAAGLEIKADFVQLSGGSSINEALLSGSIDVGGAGVGPMLTLWDRTHGRQNVRGVASLGNIPYYLISTRPGVKTIADFGDADRIAMPATGVSVQARMLQLASAAIWGDKQFDKLDRLQVGVPHPDAAAAMIRGGTEIDAHFTNPPFQEQELAGNPAAHVVLKSYDVMGGPSSASVLYATEKFRKDNPKTYKAFIDALAEAARIARTDPRKAAEIFLRTDKSTIDPKLLASILSNPELDFKITPQNTYALAAFMNRVGAIRNKPASATDYFFDDPHNAAAN